MTKFIKFEEHIIQLRNGLFAKGDSDKPKKYGIHLVNNGSTFHEFFDAEPERDARWQELETMLLVPTLAQKDSVPKLSQKETKTYYISIFKNEKHNLNDDELTASNAHKSIERAENHSFKRLLKTIEVEI